MFPRLLQLLVLAVVTTSNNILPVAAIPQAGSSLAVSQERVTYDGTQVIRISVGESVDEVNTLIRKFSLATWTDVVKEHAYVDVEVPKEKVAGFWKEFDAGGVVSGVEKVVMHEDLGKSVRMESEVTQRKAKDCTGFLCLFKSFRTSANSKIAADDLVDISWFDNYHPYEEHLAFLNELVTKFPTQTEIVVAGNSTEGNPITGIHIHSPRPANSTSAPGSPVNPAIIFHGTVHAREWITTMVTEYFAYTLLTNTTDTPYLDAYDFYIFPVVNPDGFIHTQTTARLWRKNRLFDNTTTAENPSGCIGTDINRNWDWKWEEPGSSTDPCSEAYRGTSPGSTTEFKVLSAFQNALAFNTTQGVKMYIDWHAYSQLFMSPYGYTCDVLSPDHTEHARLAAGYVDAVEQVYGVKYVGGPICTTIYQVAGDSVDYSYEVSGVKYSFAAELRDTGMHGFVLPKEQILETGRENWEGVRFLLENIE